MKTKTNEWKKLVKVSQTYWEGGRVFVACKFQWIFWNVKNRVGSRVSVKKMSPNITFYFKQTPQIHSNGISNIQTSEQTEEIVRNKYL